MRIAFLTSDSKTDRQGYYLRDTATLESLRALGHEVLPIIPSRPKQTLGQRLRYRLLSSLGFRVRTDCDRATLNGLASFVLHQLSQQAFDIVFSQSTHFTAYLHTTLPIINWVDAVYDCIVNLYPSHQHLDPWSIRAGHRAEEQALRRGSLTMLTSCWAANRAARRYKITEDMLAVVPRAAYLSEVPGAEKVARIRTCLPYGGLRCLLVGNDWYRKGVDIAVQALRRLRALSNNVSLTTVGMDVPEEFSKESWVRVLPPLRKSVYEEWHCFKNLFFETNVLILPSRADFTPNVICEAYAFGLPVIGSPVGGIPEMIEHGYTGFVTKRVDDPEEYAQFLSRLAADPGLLFHMSVQARKKFEAEYALPVVARKLASHLERVCYLNR